jgi:hypothetical protein
MPEDKLMEEKMNPQIREFPIGKRGLRKVTLYPLSAGDQFRMSKIVREGLAIYFNQIGEEQEMTPEAIAALFELIMSKFPELVHILFPEEKSPDKVIDEVTNSQMAEIVEAIWKDNFEGPSKKLRGLFRSSMTAAVQEKVSFDLERPSPQSADNTATP